MLPRRRTDRGLTAFVLVLLLVALAACHRRPDELSPAWRAVVEPLAELDVDPIICRNRIAGIRARPTVQGALLQPEERVAFYGRAEGHPVIFTEVPPPVEIAPDDEDVRVTIYRARTRYRMSGRRARLLRGGYLFTEDPEAAFHMVDRLALPDLFSEDEIWLQRGDRIHRLERVRWHEDPGYAYRHTDGAIDGERAVILFGDRVAATRDELGPPLHRDVRGLREQLGFDRMRITHLTEGAMVAELRFGEIWLEAMLVPGQGASLSLDCYAAHREQQDEAERWLAGQAPRRRALAALRRAIDALVIEKLPFDRPRDAEDHWTDGKLRPAWEYAYRKGKYGFGKGEEGYAVYDRDGRPHPPQTCVSLVLDAYERASGTWYRPLGEKPGRVIGGLDFDAYGIDNRSGVLGFERFARNEPELFVHRRIPDDERIPFADRERFFGYLREHAEDFLPGDIVAIRGMKRDGNIHQHAILIEDLDPMTGFASGLVDQMTRPRRRTWEDVMGEAPKRSLFYHLRPTPELLTQLVR